MEFRTSSLPCSDDRQLEYSSIDSSSGFDALQLDSIHLAVAGYYG